MALADQGLGDMLRKIGPDEETAMLTVLESVSGTKGPPPIWEPDDAVTPHSLRGALPASD
jgi:hypothetical protein